MLYSVFEDGKENIDSQENRQMVEEFIAPRDVLLQLCTTFYKNAVTRSEASFVLVFTTHSSAFSALV